MIERQWDPKAHVEFLPHIKMCRKIEKDTCIPLFLAALFRIARTWKQPTCSLTDNWINTVWYIHTRENYSASKRKEILTYATIWRNLKDIMLSEKNTHKNTV